MHRDLKAFLPMFDLKRAALSAFAISVLFTGQAMAVKPGHGRVTSAPGAPLQITLPLLELNAQDREVLQAKVATPELWLKAGLTPPVAIESLSVKILPGLTADSRQVIISSSQVSSMSPVDILLEVTTATGASQVQSSYLVLLPETASREAGMQDPIRINRGDTLYSIALRNAVPDADVYQMLWAIFQANPQAFIADNMNMLRAGGLLRIPDADTVRSVDAKMARAIYLKHLNDFNRRKGGNSVATVAKLMPGPTQSGVVMPASPPPPVKSEKVDQVLLSAASDAEKKADVKVSATKEIAELESRISALQKNVDQLKEIVKEPAASVSAPGQTSTAAPGQTSAMSRGQTLASAPGQTLASAPGQTSALASGQTSPPANGQAAASAPGQASSSASGQASAPATGQASEAKTTTSSKSASSLPGAVVSDTKPGLSGEAAAPSGSQPPAAAFERITSFLAENILMVLTAVLALAALVIAWIMRQAGTRPSEDSEYQDATVPLTPAAQAAFSKSLGSIDLSLGDEPVKTKTDPTIPKPL